MFEDDLCGVYSILNYCIKLAGRNAAVSVLPNLVCGGLGGGVIKFLIEYFCQ